MTHSRIRTAHLLLGAVLLFMALVAPATHPASAQTGADIAATITGPLRVRIGDYITYTVTGTNVGDATATDVQLAGWGPDWFGDSSVDCFTGTPGGGVCVYGDLAPGASASMTITLKAVAGNKQERRMYELGWATASNDLNPNNDEARIAVNMTGPCRNCPNK
jgi:uncharacterized protein DUF11